MKTIQELKAFFESIPAENWCTYSFEIKQEGITKRCALGHYNFHLSGEAVPGFLKAYGPCEEPLKEINIFPGELIAANNGWDISNYQNVGHSAKERVINFLDNKLNEVV